MQTSTGTAYDIAGAADAPVVVLIHGLGLNRQTWDMHVSVLSERYRVLTYDLCGHGESVQAKGQPTLTVFSQQLAQLLGELKISRCAVIGFSLGGMINRRFVMDNPGVVSALGIFNSPHERGPAAQKLVEERAAQSAAGGPAATLEATIERWFTPDFRAKRPDVIKQVSAWVLANDLKVFAQTRHVLAHGVKELIRPKPPIAVPSLIMTCENDSGSTPAMSFAIASEIENARTIIVPQLQHMAIMEQPDLFTAPLLRFLNDVLTR